MIGSIDFIGEAGHLFSSMEGAHVLHEREPHPGLCAHDKLPDDTRLWAALQQASGGTWGGCVYDVDSILRAIHGAYSPFSATDDLDADIQGLA
jgi:hypothetical protein